jgi:hypothetical protein
MHFSLRLLSKNVSAPVDSRIKATVVAFILNYLEQHPENVLFYNTRAADSKEHQRRTKFDRWFITTPERPEFICMTRQTLEDQEIHFLYRKDRPNVVALINDIESYSLLPRHLLRS